MSLHAGWVGSTLVLGALLIAPRAVRADSVTVDSEVLGASLPQLSREVLLYFPALRQQESWGLRQMRLLRGRNVRLRFSLGPLPAVPAGPRLIVAPDVMPSAGGEGAPPARASRPVEEEFGADLHDQGFAATEEELLQGVPDVALHLTDLLIRFADGTLLLAANFRRMLNLEAGVDLRKLVYARRLLLSKRMRAATAAGPAAGRARSQEVASRMRVKRVVRSAFRICLGIAIGLGLWMIVRHL